MKWKSLHPLCAFPPAPSVTRWLVLSSGLALVLGAGLAFAQGLDLSPWSGAVPGDAVAAGQGADGSDLFVCVASSWGGEHPGRLTADGICHVPWGGKEHSFDGDFLVLVGSSSAAVAWQPVTKGKVPAGAYPAGDDGGPIYVCRVDTKDGLLPGKLTDDGWCYVAISGNELTFADGYEVLVE
jgi:hypothetical protein